MDELRKDRIKMIKECMNKLREIRELYKEAYPGWILANSACGFIDSIDFLESNPNFDKKSLGVKFKENNTE